MDCLLCGVGGQGTVLASRIIAAAGMKKGMDAKTAETIGMAQRGGSVVSHVRIGKNIFSPLIPYGSADIIIGFEPGEVVNNLAYLKKDGCVIVCKQLIPSINSLLANMKYDESVITFIKENVKRVYVVDGEKICQECGSSKVLNIALIGVMLKETDFSYEDIVEVLNEKVKPQFLELNKKALKLGMEL